MNLVVLLTILGAPFSFKGAETLRPAPITNASRFSAFGSDKLDVKCGGGGWANARACAERFAASLNRLRASTETADALSPLVNRVPPFCGDPFATETPLPNAPPAPSTKDDGGERLFARRISL